MPSSKPRKSDVPQATGSLAASHPTARKIGRPTPSWLMPVALALATIFLIGLFSTELSDTDSWWHLATGRYIAEHRSLSYPDPFAYTTAMAKPAYPGETATQRFNLTHEWLAQIAMYAAWALGGMAGVVLWKALLLALACALVGHITRVRTGSYWWGIAAMFAASPVLTVFAHDRPSILSYVFAIAFIAVFEDRRRLWLLPALALVWANCHGGFFLGWAVCGAYCAGAFFRRDKDWKRVVTFSAVAVLVSGLNPNGFGVVTTLASYRRSPMTASLMEWSRPGLWGEPVAFFVLLYGAVTVLAFSWRKVRISDWLLFLAFAAASLAAFRNLPLMALLAPVLIATYWPGKLAAANAAAIIKALALPLLAAGVVWGIASGRFFQLRAAEWRFPQGAASFLLERAPHARVFNTYEDGGYLIWRGIHPFIDGRSLSESVFQDYRLILGTEPGDPRRDARLARYGIDAIALNAFEYNSGIVYPLVFALAQPAESEWKLVYEDAAAMVFLHNPPPDMPALDKSRIADHLEAECALHVSRDPEFSLCARALGELFLRMGDRPRALRNLGLYLDHPYDNDPRPRQEYLRLAQPR